MQEKPSVVIPAVDFKDEVKNSSWKKYAIISGSIVIILAIITAGFVLSFYFMSKNHDKIISHVSNFKTETGKKVTEESEVNVDENTVYYTIGSEDNGVYHLVEDYNRKLFTARIDYGGITFCIVHALNGSGNAIDALTDDSKNVTTRRTAVILDPVPITNTDFLAPRAQTMCKGHQVHWATTTCADNKDTERMKRRDALLICKKHGDHWDCILIIFV